MDPPRTPPDLPPQLAARPRALRIAAAVAPAARTVHAGPAGVAVPGDWAPVAVVPGVAVQSPHAAAAFQLVTALPAYALVAFGPAQDVTLVPAPLRALLGNAVPKPKPTTLGGARAWRYGETPVAGGRTMEVTVAPTSSGVLAV